MYRQAGISTFAKQIISGPVRKSTGPNETFFHGKLYGILPVVANITDGSLEDSLVLVLKVKETY
jgi:hypothetical protein